MNLLGLGINSGGIGWYALEKYLEAKKKMKPQGGVKGGEGESPFSTDRLMLLSRDGSQVDS